ncbi:MAG TPA: hypothetical protein VFY98_03795 [Intrasporangium sp.]|nr:hypothetical protein [Intrasporangium sp.]
MQGERRGGRSGPIEEYYARVAAVTDDEGRLPVAVEEPPRHGEDPAECWCSQPTGLPTGLAAELGELIVAVGDAIEHVHVGGRGGALGR